MMMPTSGFTAALYIRRRKTYIPALSRPRLVGQQPLAPLLEHVLAPHALPVDFAARASVADGLDVDVRITLAMYISCRRRAPWLVMLRQAMTASRSFSGSSIASSSTSGNSTSSTPMARRLLVLSLELALARAVVGLWGVVVVLSVVLPGNLLARHESALFRMLARRAEARTAARIAA
jgi:hypothetical protein